MSRKSLQECAETLFEDMYEAVAGQRYDDYGDPLPQFARVAKMWSAIIDCDVTPRQVLLCMIALKLAREENSHKWDNIVDIAGYAVILAEGEDENWTSGDD